MPTLFMSGGSGDSRELLLHKMEVLQLKLEERELELEAARGQANETSSDQNNVREAKMKELAKRAKAATMALGRERASCAQLRAEVAMHKEVAHELGRNLSEAREWAESLLEELETAQATIFELRREGKSTEK